jgi:hypothetical protein
VASQVTRVETGFGEADVAGWSDRAAPAGLGGVVAPVWAAIMVVSAFTLAWRKRPEPMSVGVLGLCAGLVASPVLHTHYTLMLAVPVAWIARRGLLDAAAWMVAAGVALAALPMHQAEAAYWFRYLPGIGLYWLFVTHGLAAVMLATAGVAIGVIRDSGGITSTTRQ